MGDGTTALDRLRRLSQTGYVFLAIGVAGAVGLFLLSIQALTRPGWVAGWRYLFIGGMAAISGLGAGGIVGLIFGLPESSTMVVAGSSSKAPGDAAAPESPRDAANSGDWYRDSSSLERIATWLTGAIIALSLANFDSWTTRFSSMSRSIGLAMLGSSTADLELASMRVADASFQLAQVTRRTNESDRVFQERRRAAIGNLDLANAAALRATSEAEVPGGLLLGGYALLGFAASYIWTRRYLPAEFASGRRDMRQITRQDARDTAELAGARASNLAQAAPKSATDPAAAAAAVTAAQTAAAGVGANLVQAPAIVSPGPVRDDPWKGRFGGLSSNSVAEILAVVREVAGRPGLYIVSLGIRGRGAAGQSRLAGTDARIYLHPTFPQPIIRLMTFGATGTIELTLSAVGAFTLGVQLMVTGDLLELDLAGLQDAPPAFRLN